MTYRQGIGLQAFDRALIRPERTGHSFTKSPPWRESSKGLLACLLPPTFNLLVSITFYSSCKLRRPLGLLWREILEALRYELGLLPTSRRKAMEKLLGAEKPKR